MAIPLIKSPRDWKELISFLLNSTDLRPSYEKDEPVVTHNKTLYITRYKLWYNSCYIVCTKTHREESRYEFRLDTSDDYKVNVSSGTYNVDVTHLFSARQMYQHFENLYNSHQFNFILPQIEEKLFGQN